MSNNPLPFRRFLVVPFMVLFMSGCGLIGDKSSGLPDDGPPIPVSKEAAIRFAQKTISGAGGIENGGVFQFTVTQEEVTSALSIGAQLLANSQGGPVFEGIPGSEGMEGAQDLENLIQSQGSDALNGNEIPPQFVDVLENLKRDGDGGIPVPDIRIKLEEPQVYFRGDGRIILRGYGRLLRWKWPLRMVIAPQASQGELVLDFVEGQIGSLPMPEFLFDPLGNLLAKVLLSGREYAEVTALTVREGTLTFSGRLNLEQ